MFGISDAHHFRKMVAGFCMVFAPLCMLVGFLVDPDAEYAFLFAGSVLMVPAMLGLMHMLREREVAFGHVGGGLSLIGLLGFMGLTSLALVQWQMVAGGSTAQMTDLLHRMNHTTGMAVPFALGI